MGLTGGDVEEEVAAAHDETTVGWEIFDTQVDTARGEGDQPATEKRGPELRRLSRGVRRYT